MRTDLTRVGPSRPRALREKARPARVMPTGEVCRSVQGRPLRTVMLHEGRGGGISTSQPPAPVLSSLMDSRRGGSELCQAPHPRGVHLWRRDGLAVPPNLE